MKKIVRYIDSLMDPFPYNNQTENIRVALQTHADELYHSYLEEGMSSTQAYEEVINQLPDPHEIASYIPNKRSYFYYMMLIVLLFVTGAILIVVNRPHFLQIFYPLELIFPHIIRHYIFHLLIVMWTYLVVDFILPFLPASKIEFGPKTTAAIQYGVTILMALYFSIMVAFCWFTFNGFNEAEFTVSPIPLFLYKFYGWIIKPLVSTILYSILCGGLVALGKKHYHLDRKPPIFQLDLFFKPTPTPKPVDTIPLEIETTSLWRDYCRDHYFKSAKDKKDFLPCSEPQK